MSVAAGVAQQFNHRIPDSSGGVVECETGNEGESSPLLPVLFSDSHFVVSIFLVFQFFLSSMVQAPVVFCWLFQTTHVFRVSDPTCRCLWNTMNWWCDKDSHTAILVQSDSMRMPLLYRRCFSGWFTGIKCNQSYYKTVCSVT